VQCDPLVAAVVAVVDDAPGVPEDATLDDVSVVFDGGVTVRLFELHAPARPTNNAPAHTTRAARAARLTGSSRT
jgi:hypothetical protein